VLHTVGGTWNRVILTLLCQLQVSMPTRGLDRSNTTSTHERTLTSPATSPSVHVARWPASRCPGQNEAPIPAARSGGKPASERAGGRGRGAAGKLYLRRASLTGRFDADTAAGPSARPHPRAGLARRPASRSAWVPAALGSASAASQRRRRRQLCAVHLKDSGGVVQLQFDGVERSGS
jgi:hypothetical protein